MKELYLDDFWLDKNNKTNIEKVLKNDDNSISFFTTKEDDRPESIKSRSIVFLKDGTAKLLTESIKETREIVFNKEETELWVEIMKIDHQKVLDEINSENLQSTLEKTSVKKNQTTKPKRV